MSQLLALTALAQTKCQRSVAALIDIYIQSFKNFQSGTCITVFTAITARHHQPSRAEALMLAYLGLEDPNPAIEPD